jgi:S1-C subfamily serine protease
MARAPQTLLPALLGPVVLLAAAPALAQPRSDGLAYVRVVGDLSVEFEDARAPVRRAGVEIASGTAFVVAPSGLLITSRHVIVTPPRAIDGAVVSVERSRVEVAIATPAGTRALDAWVAAQDEDLDLAALQVTASELPYLPLGDSDALEAAQPVRILGFPFGRKVEVARTGADVVPEPSVTVGSLSAARSDEAGETRFLQTDASVNPGNSGGPMLDEDGYVQGVVKMKLSSRTGEPGAAFAVPVALVKDFLDAHGLLDGVPAPRLRPGVVHSLDWKGVRLELPDGFADRAPSRLRVEAGEAEAVSLAVERFPSPLPAVEVEERLLGGLELPRLVAAPASPRRRPAQGPGARLLLLGSAEGTAPDGQPFRVEYAIADLGSEVVVARYLGLPDTIAFNLGLVRRSLRSLEADALPHGPIRPRPAAPSARYEERALAPADEHPLPLPAGWIAEPEAEPACGGPPAEASLTARHPQSYGVAFRVLRWDDTRAAARAVSGCVRAGGGVRSTSGYTSRRERLGVSWDRVGLVVARGGTALLLELEAPSQDAPAVRPLFDAWASAVAGGS